MSCVLRNLYTCPASGPKHLAVAVNKWKYRLIYNSYFGGVTALSKKQFEDINGFANRYCSRFGCSASPFIHHSYCLAMLSFDYNAILLKLLGVLSSFNKLTIGRQRDSSHSLSPWIRATFSINKSVALHLECFCKWLNYLFHSDPYCCFPSLVAQQVLLKRTYT